MAGLSQDIWLDGQNRTVLQEMYDELLLFCKSLPEEVQTSSYPTYTDLQEIIEMRKKELDTRELTILVAGEHGAGKSSLINLLLEVDILPVHEYGSTKTFCELQKSANGEKRALCFYKTCPSSTSPLEVIELNNAHGIEDLKKRIIEKNQTEKSPYERIEIFMPFKVLEDGIVIVDCPNIGEHEMTTGQRERYLNLTLGAIYLVNTASDRAFNLEEVR